MDKPTLGDVVKKPKVKKNPNLGPKKITREQRAARNKRICALRRKGETLCAIGAEVGLGGYSVERILRQFGLAPQRVPGNPPGPQPKKKQKRKSA